MCQSAAQGGQRCSSSTRPAFQHALATANREGYEAEFDNAAIEHATTRQGRDEVEALLTFATNDRIRLRIENLLAQADQLRARREAVNAEVNQQIAAHENAAATRSHLRLVRDTDAATLSQSESARSATAR